MLQVLRDSMKYLAWILWAVIAVFVLFVFVDFGGGMPRGQLPTSAAATVGPHEIPYSEFHRTLRNMEDEMRRRLGDQYDPEMVRQQQLPLRAIDRLINQRLLQDEALSSGLAVSDQELRDYLLEIPAFQDDAGRFLGWESYRGMVLRMGYQVDEFEGAVRNDLIVNKLLRVMGDSVYLADSEVEEQYRQFNERASIRYLEIPSNRFLEEVSPTQEETEAHFAEHQEEYRVPEQRVAEYLLVQISPLRTTMEIPEEDIQASYQEHLEDYTIKEQVRARQILVATGPDRSNADAEARALELKARIQLGEDFSNLATETSDDDRTKARGGDMGFTPRGRLEPALEEALFGAQAGNLVGPIAGSQGAYLFEIMDQRPERIRPLEEVTAQVRNRLAQERATSAAEELAGSLYARLLEAESPEQGMAALAEEHQAVAVDSTEPFGREDAIPGIGRGSDFSRLAFELASDDVSEPVRVPQGWAILRVKETLDPRLPSLDEVADQVRNEVRAAKAKDVALERLQESRAQINQGAQSFDDVALEWGVQIRESSPFGRGPFIPGLGIQPELADAALQLEEGEVGAPVTSESGVILYEVTQRTHFDPLEFAERRAEFEGLLRDQRAQQLVSNRIDERRRELGVRYDNRLVEALELQDGQS